MNNVINHIEESLGKAYSYEEYLKLVEDLLADNQSTTKDAGEMAEDFVHYSKLGLQRMKRWNKRFSLSEAQKAKIAEVNHPQIWVVLTEGWCGDAAHSVPIVNALAAANKNIELKLVLREENLDLMNDFLTNGGKSIPKLIVYNPETKTVEGTWGPRPVPAQEIFLEAVEKGIEFETYEQDLQTWYNKDKGQTAVQELLAIL